MKKFSKKTLATVLKDYRIRHQLTQEDLANKVGINRSLVSRIEQEKFVPSIAQLESLAELTNHKIEDFFQLNKNLHKRLSPVALLQWQD